MEFTEIIKTINSDKRLIPDLMKSEKGNNFRAISESAILDVIDPVLKKAGWFYTVTVKKSDLQIREAYSSKGKKLQFIATVEIALDFETFSIPVGVGAVHTEAVGMGIDDNDKAMGKAYTYAVKYALLKLFRLRYGDDSDAKASEPLLTEKAKTTEAEKETTPAKTEKSGSKSKKEQLMTQAQKDYIIGLMKQKGVSETNVLEKFGVEPSIDDYITMKQARAILTWLENFDDLPF